MRLVGIGAALAGLAALLAIPAGRASASDPSSCRALDVDYAVNTSLELRDTQMGAADGIYPSGSGTLRLRFDGPPEGPGANARLTAYTVQGRTQIVTRALMFSTRVVTDARYSARTAGPDGAAHGSLRDGVLRWATKLAGYRVDGTMTCDGSFCGSFGAPPRGTSPLHDGPMDVDFQPFVFSKDRHTFTMARSLVSRGAGQTSFLLLAGRETARSCADPP